MTLVDSLPAESQRRQARPARHPLIWTALASLLISVPAALIMQGDPSDLRVYRAGGYAWLHDVGLYSPEFFELTPGRHLPFVYPPLAAVLFASMTMVPWQLLVLLFTASGVAGLAVTAHVTARRIYGHTSKALLVASLVTAGWFLLQPARDTVSWGQINLILMGMVTADCLLPRIRWPRGMLLGLAAAIKLTPAACGLYFLLRRQYKAAAVSAASFAGFSLLGCTLAPGDSVRFWTDAVLSDRVGIGYYMNQGVRGLLHRFDLPQVAELALWAAIVVGLLVLTVFAARRALAEGQPVAALLAIAVCGLLASPISWAHHWVWVVVAAVALPRVFARSGTVTRCLLVGVMLVFVTGPLWFGGIDPAWLRYIVVSPYLFAGVGLLIALAVGCPRLRPAAPTRTPQRDELPERACVALS